MSSKIYTKKGDKGKTSLFSGEVVYKTSPRVQAYGTIDELNASISIAKLHAPAEVADILQKVQERLFYLASEIATGEPDKIIKKVEPHEIEDIEKLIDHMTQKMPIIENFLVPGGSKASAIIHLSRTVCRRAERRIIELIEVEEINPDALKYVNRLSDLLFTLARYANFLQGIDDQVISKEGVREQKSD